MYFSVIIVINSAFSAAFISLKQVLLDQVVSNIIKDFISYYEQMSSYK